MMRRFAGVLALIGGLALAALLFAATPALAHATLIGTEPSDGATVNKRLSEVALVFDQPVEPDFAQIQVFGPDGERVDAGRPRVAGTRFIQPLERLVAHGEFTVVFRVISSDGHPVENRFPFTYNGPVPARSEANAPDPRPEDGANPPDPRATATPSPAQPTATPSPSPSTSASPSASPGTAAAPTPPEPSETAAVAGDDLGSPDGFQLQTAGPVTAAGLWVSRALNYLALTAMVGVLLTAVWLLAAPKGQSGEGLGSGGKRLLRVAITVGAVWVASAAGLFVFGLSNAAAEPVGQVIGLGPAARFAGTRFGGAVLAQAAAALAVVMLSVIASRRDSRAVAIGALALTAVAGFAPAWWGHAATGDLPLIGVASDWAHVLAATVWAGGLGTLVFIARPRFGDVELGPPVRRFSAAAGWSLAVVLATGLTNALLGIDTLSQLVTTGWGRLVLLKLALFGGIAALGLANRRRMVPRFASGDDSSATRRLFRKIAVAEVALMLAAFGTATTLASGIPADAEAASHLASVVADFGDGRLNLTIDPGTSGNNTVHLYFFGADGQPVEVGEATLTLSADDTNVDIPLFVAGPGHYVNPAAPIPHAGGYTVTVGGQMPGGAETATSAVTLSS